MRNLTIAQERLIAALTECSAPKSAVYERAAQFGVAIEICWDEFTPEEIEEARRHGYLIDPDQVHTQIYVWAPERQVFHEEGHGFQVHNFDAGEAADWPEIGRRIEAALPLVPCPDWPECEDCEVLEEDRRQRSKA